jgi:hypothetical protein
MVEGPDSVLVEEVVHALADVVRNVVGAAKETRSCAA